MKIALFGGTFNPPHLGHVHVVRELSKRFDEVWVVVAADPNKTEKPYVPPEHRLRMAELAFVGLAGVKNVRVVDVELKRAGVSYTIDTIRQLQADFPGNEFWWVIGSDLVADFPRWKQSDALAQSVPFLVVSRPGFAIDDGALRCFAKVDILQDEGVDASSTQLREWLNSGKGSEAKKWIPLAVFDYLQKNGLYC